MCEVGGMVCPPGWPLCYQLTYVQYLQIQFGQVEYYLECYNDNDTHGCLSILHHNWSWRSSQTRKLCEHAYLQWFWIYESSLALMLCRLLSKVCGTSSVINCIITNRSGWDASSIWNIFIFQDSFNTEMVMWEYVSSYSRVRYGYWKLGACGVLVCLRMTTNMICCWVGGLMPKGQYAPRELLEGLGRFI